MEGIQQTKDLVEHKDETMKEEDDQEEEEEQENLVRSRFLLIKNIGSMGLTW